MSKQAENSIGLYRGNDPATIEQLLGFQSQSVVRELQDFFKASNIHELALKLSIYKWHE